MRIARDMPEPRGIGQRINQEASAIPHEPDGVGLRRAIAAHRGQPDDDLLAQAPGHALAKRCLGIGERKTHRYLLVAPSHSQAALSATALASIVRALALTATPRPSRRSPQNWRTGLGDLHDPLRRRASLMTSHERVRALAHI